MKTISCFVLFLALSTSAFSQVVWLHEDFTRSSLSPDWTSLGGDWHLEKDQVRIQTKEYDQLLASSFFVNGLSAYTFEVTLRGLRAGVYFSLDDPASKALSHMVRFDEENLLVGYFDAAGVYVATNTFDVPGAATTFRTLRIEIDPPHKRYALYVGGTLLGVDTTLLYASGNIGLQASEGISEFTRIRITGASPPVPSQLPPIGTKLFLQRLSYIETRNQDVVVYDPTCNALVQIDSTGTVARTELLPHPPRGKTSVHIGNRLFAIAGNRVLVSSGDGTIVDSLVEFLVKPSCIVSNGTDIFVADPGARAVFQYTATGQMKKKIDAAVIGGFTAPRGLALSRSGELVIADYERLVLWREDSDTDPILQTNANGTPISLQWRTNASAPGRLEYAADGQAWRTIALAAGTPGLRQASFPALLPLTRYSYRFFPALKAIPSSASMSRTYRVATPPPHAGTIMMTRLPVLCLVYRTISYRDRYPALIYPLVPDGKTLSEEDIMSLRHAVDFNRDFYFRNSSCRLVLDFDFHVVEDTLWLSEVGEADPYWLGPTARVVKGYEEAARSHGKRPEEYCGLIVPYAWINYPPRETSGLRNPGRKDTIMIRQAVGGGTYGIPAPWKYGKTAGYTGNPFPDRFSRQDWLITHEFHHQIDALMKLSGFPEYYHADQPWEMPGAFGEDFDFNAQIVRKMPPTSWLSLTFGSLTASLDSDLDGVPDDDPSLPFDEKRLGSNTSSKDTDGDGVTDLAEVMAGHSRGTGLLTPDTDVDGLPDGLDPEPLYPISPLLKKIRDLNQIWTHPFGVVRDSLMTAEFFVAWTDSALVVSCKSTKPVNVLCQIDAENDGWFHGFDNFQIRVLSNEDSARVGDYYLRDCSSWTKPPRDRRDVLRPADLSIRLSKSSQALEGSRYQLTTEIPRVDSYGLSYVPKKRFRIRLAVQTDTDMWLWNELFERNTMMQVELR